MNQAQARTAGVCRIAAHLILHCKSTESRRTIYNFISDHHKILPHHLMNLIATIAAAAFVADFPSSSSAFLHQSKDASILVSTLQHQYARESFSELDKLKSKRLSIRRRPIEQTDVVVEGGIVDSSSELVLEYLYDETEEERHSDDLYHIILMPSTFHKTSIDHAAEACTDILGIESEKAYSMSIFAKHQGFSTLGTWTHDECLSKGKELLSRDLDCRIIPFNKGGSSIVSEEVVIPIENKYIPIQRRLSWESRCLPSSTEDIVDESTETIIEEFYLYA